MSAVGESGSGSDALWTDVWFTVVFGLCTNDRCLWVRRVGQCIAIWSDTDIDGRTVRECFTMGP